MKNLIAVAIVMFLALPAFAEVSIGIVNVQKILVTVKEGQGIREKLKGEFEKKQKIVKEDEDKIRSAQENLKKQSAVLNAQAREKKEQEVQQMFMELQKKTSDFQRDMQSMEERYKGPILEKIKTIVTKISKDEGVDATFELSTTPILYAKKQVDLTDKIIAAYDKENP